MDEEHEEEVKRGKTGERKLYEDFGNNGATETTQLRLKSKYGE